MEQKICPYLGLRDDPNTNKGYPYEGNICFRAKKPTPVALSQQRGYCLSNEHTACPGYNNGWVNGFPNSLKAYLPTYKRVLQNKWVWLTLAVVLLFGIYFIFQQQINAMWSNLRISVSSRNNEPSSTAAAQSTSMPTRTRVPPTLTASHTPSATETRTSAFTKTNTPTAALTSTATETPSQMTEEPTYMVEVISEALNVRSEPIYMANGSNIVDTLTKDEIIEVFDEQKGWLLTERGWIFKAYTKKILD